METFYAERQGSIDEGITVTRIKNTVSEEVLATILSMRDQYSGKRFERWRGPILVCNSPLPEFIDTPSIEESWQVPRNLPPEYNIPIPNPEGHPPQHEQYVERVLAVLSGN